MAVPQQITACKKGLSQEGVLFTSTGQRMGHVCSVRKIFPTSSRLLVCLLHLAKRAWKKKKLQQSVQSKLMQFFFHLLLRQKWTFSSVDGVETAARQNKLMKS